ncbi:hypothetical protein RND81_06G008300 [Saponaria officinalis]|uniref:Uncharacterized protein n=1 Tax=Saponaria officinalis TaxID=3572 RepID=A0AAW1K4S2_SAPOF
MNPDNHHSHHPNHPPHTSGSRAEAERLLGVVKKLLHSREFALLARESDPFLNGSDQFLAISDVLLASDKRVNTNRYNDWYSILQTDRRT